MLTAKSYFLRLGLCAAGLGVLLVLSPGVGTESASFGWWDAWRAKLGWPISAVELADRPFVDIDNDGRITEDEVAGYVAQAKYVGFELRFARTLVALQVGVTLALCGAAFQVLFRNPLAEPYTLGIASGGSLGALIAIRAGWVFSLAGLSSVSLSALIGGLVVVSGVFLIARGRRRLTTNELVLAGVTMGLFCSAMMMFVTALSSERTMFTTIRWMLGSLDPMTRAQRVMMLPLLLPAWIVLLLGARALNQYRLGDELASTRGVAVPRLVGVHVLVCTLATAAVVARCGPIGFVGLVVPHIATLLVGSDCRILLPASGLLGGVFLILCDWGCQLSMRMAGWLTGQELGSATLPIGAVTAIVGVPVFLILLRARQRS